MADLTGTVDGLPDLPAQPANMRELRAWAAMRYQTSDRHVEDVCADDDGVEACDRARGYLAAWDVVVEVLDHAFEVAQALKTLRFRHDRATAAVATGVREVSAAFLEARVEVYAEAVETVAGVPGAPGVGS